MKRFFAIFTTVIVTKQSNNSACHFNQMSSSPWLFFQLSIPYWNQTTSVIACWTGMCLPQPQTNTECFATIIELWLSCRRTLKITLLTGGFNHLQSLLFESIVWKAKQRTYLWLFNYVQRHFTKFSYRFPRPQFKKCSILETTSHLAKKMLLSVFTFLLTSLASGVETSLFLHCLPIEFQFSRWRSSTASFCTSSLASKLFNSKHELVFQRLT